MNALRHSHDNSISGGTVIPSNSPFVEFPAVPSEEMAFALSIFVSAANGQLLATSTTRREFHYDDQECWNQFESMCKLAPFEEPPEPGPEPPKTTHYSAFRALWRQYEGDEHRFSLCARVLSFHLLMLQTRGAVAEEWLVPCPGKPDAVLLHPGLVDAVASIPLYPDRHWEERYFREAVVPHVARRSTATHPECPDSILRSLSQYLEDASVLQSAGAKAGRIAEMILTCEILEQDAAARGLSMQTHFYEVLRGPLSSLIGVVGFRSLVERALRLGQRDAPELRHVQLSVDGTLAGLDCTPKPAAAVLIAHLILLPTAFVGPEVTVQLLRRH